MVWRATPNNWAEYIQHLLSSQRTSYIRANTALLSNWLPWAAQSSRPNAHQIQGAIPMWELAMSPQDSIHRTSGTETQALVTDFLERAPPQFSEQSQFERLMIFAKSNNSVTFVLILLWKSSRPIDSSCKDTQILLSLNVSYFEIIHQYFSHLSLPPPSPCSSISFLIPKLQNPLTLWYILMSQYAFRGNSTKHM